MTPKYLSYYQQSITIPEQYGTYDSDALFAERNVIMNLAIQTHYLNNTNFGKQSESHQTMAFCSYFLPNSQDAASDNPKTK